MSNANVDSRFKWMLDSLQQMDPTIENIVVYSKFVVGYLLQQNGPNPGWRKANIEGPVYLLRRRQAPKYQLLIKNQCRAHDLLDNLHPDWELDCQKHYVFYKVEDCEQKIRGLWFHDDAERQRIETALENTLEEVRRATGAPQPSPPVTNDGTQETSQAQPLLQQPHQQQQVQTYTGGSEQVVVTTATLRSALISLASDETFLNMLMAKLQEASHESQASQG